MEVLSQWANMVPQMPPEMIRPKARQSKMAVGPKNRKCHQKSPLSGMCERCMAPTSHLTPHLSRYIVNGLMAQGERLDLPRVPLQSTRLADAANQRPEENTPVLLHVDHPPPSLMPKCSSRCNSRSEVSKLLSHKQSASTGRSSFSDLFSKPSQYCPKACSIRILEGDDQQDNASLALAASLYATALPFAMHDDHLSATLTDVSDKREQLYSIAVTAILEEAHRSTIELLQACLLLLQKGPTAQHCGLTPAYAWLTSMAVTMARCLGLHYDCSNWNIPLAHKQLRTRLWWATFVMDIWVSLDSPGGRSIGPDEDTAGEIDIISNDSRHFYHLLDITAFCHEYMKRIALCVPQWIRPRIYPNPWNLLDRCALI